MNELGKTVIKGKLRIVTPVHVGGAQEKHLQKGLDYISKDGTVYFLDDKKLISHFGVHKYSDALSQGKIEQILGSLNVDDFSSKMVKSISGEIGTDIKSNIKNSLSNKPIIPGSSLKGSLRSVFYNFIVGDNPPKYENDVFGKISEDIFRYMIVSDVEFNTSSYINIKTFNLRSTGRDGFGGGWKHELRGNTNEFFKASGFTFPHEVISTDDIGEYSITLNQKALSLAISESKVKHNRYTDQIFKGSEGDVFAIIQTYMALYLKKEKDFFTKYETDQTGCIVDELDRLIELNKQAPLLRLGLGSGFHAMTGDTLHDSHYINGVFENKGRSRGQFNNQDSAKSRKIAFKGSGENLALLPMGFVQLCTEDFYNSHYKESFEAKKLALIQQEIKQKEKDIASREAFEYSRIQAAEVAAKQAAKEEQARLELLQPQMTDVSLLKKAKWVDGIVVGQNGKMLKFRPFVIGFEDKVFEISYSAGMINDTIIQVMCMSANGKALQFQGSPKVKS